MYGSVVRRARAARGLTQVELSEVSGIAQANISAIENDRRHPSTETLHRLLLSCGFELVAVAGSRTIPLPPPLDDGDPHVLGDLLWADPDPDDPQELTEPAARTLTTEQRAEMLRGVLDVSEAIVRSR